MIHLKSKSRKKWVQFSIYRLTGYSQVKLRMMFKLILFVVVIALSALINASSANFICPSKEGVFPNPYGSNGFYQCSGGDAFLMECPAGLIFNPPKHVCDWPSNVSTSSNPVKTDVSSSKTQDGGRTSSGSAVDPATGVIAKFTCPVFNGMLQVERDCSHFVHCEQGIGYWKACGQGLYFNVKRQICDWPEHSGCVQRGAPPNTYKVIKPDYLVQPSSVRPNWNELPSHDLDPIAKPINPIKPTYPINSANPKPTRPTNEGTINVEDPEMPKVDKVDPNTDLDTKPTSGDDANEQYVCDWCFKCPAKSGFYANTYDSHTYYECVHGAALMRFCMNKMIYDPSLGHCKKGDPTTLIQARGSNNSASTRSG